MRPLPFVKLLLLAAAAGPALGQNAPPLRHESRTFEAGVSYTYLRAKILPACNCVSLNGGSAEAQYNFTHRYAALADFTLVHRGNITPDGYALTQFTYAIGLRVYPVKARARVQPFAEALLGAAHVSGTLAPVNTGAGPSNNSLTFQVGAGLTYRLPHHLTLRPLQADYLLTTLSNNAADRQNDLRMSTGLNYRFGR